MSRASKKWAAPDPQQYIVQMKNLTSNEVYLSQSGEQTPVLRENTLDICRGESWAIVGTEAFEVELLLQIMGCVRPYGSGSCKLVERGMMRKKRRILPHVFYVGDSMAVPNMNVLEYLMFATQHTKTPARDRQASILEAMLDAGCYGWCFAPVKALTPQERAVLSLFAASFSTSLLLIFPYFFKVTTPELRGMLGTIASNVRKNRAALVMGVCDPTLAEKTCTNAGFLLGGTIRHKGTAQQIMSDWDKRDYIISTGDADALAALLRERLPDCDVRLSHRDVEVYHRDSEPVTQERLLAAIAGMPFDLIRRSEKTIENAFMEAQNDLSNELL